MALAADPADESVVHVYPADDWIEHDRTSTTCICGPRVEQVTRADGSAGMVVVHHALDGRDRAE